MKGLPNFQTDWLMLLFLFDIHDLVWHFKTILIDSYSEKTRIIDVSV